jgi:hypothetical protein
MQYSSDKSKLSLFDYEVPDNHGLPPTKSPQANRQLPSVTRKKSWHQKGAGILSEAGRAFAACAVEGPAVALRCSPNCFGDKS